jgi:hypothetical protein
MTAAKIFGWEPALRAAFLNAVTSGRGGHHRGGLRGARHGCHLQHRGRCVGLVKAVLALLLGFGLKMSADQQAGITGMFVRTQATALVGPDGAKRTTVAAS